MQTIDDKTLIHVYLQALITEGMFKEFIELLLEEIKRRNLPIPDKK